MPRSAAGRPKPSDGRSRIKPIPVKELGHQAQHSSRDFMGVPLYHLYAYRNNLCSYSQVYNLLFVANSNTIFVHEPQYPDQTTPDAALIIDPPMLATRWRPQMPGHPHGINHLLVANLGYQEIVVCACDDGDVYAYYTSQMLSSVTRIKGQRSEGDVESLKDETLQPFFHVNVGASAWGLAVHQQARMIAISCNSHDISVYALALATDSEPEKDDIMSLVNDGSNSNEAPENIDEGIAETLESPDVESSSSSSWSRTADQLFFLEGHRDNIPSISFCNTPEDVNGNYLISTDIDGQTFVWDIQLGEIIIALRHTNAETGQERHRLPWAGWALLWIDRRAFEKAKETSHAFGDHNLLSTSGGTIVDVSKQKHKIRDTGAWSSSMTETESPRRHPVSSHETSSQAPDSSESEGITDDTGSISRSMFMGEQFCIMRNYNKLLNESYLGDYKKLPSSPFFLAHGINVNLFQPFVYDEQEWKKSPVVHMFEPLQQIIDDGLHDRLNIFDRIYLQSQIPELGVVVLGSQIGRVAVLTLYQLEPGTVDGCTRSLYGFRLNHILPFHSQEKRGLRPDFPLVGLSTAPIQGTQDRAGSSRRYRIVLVYANRTMLTYEIGRDQESSLSQSDQVLMI